MFSPLHRPEKAFERKMIVIGVQPHKRVALGKRITEFLILLLLHYKWLLLGVWIAGVIFWLVSELLLGEPASLHTD